MQNGFLVAEVCARYYPNDVAMHSFDNGSSRATRVDNWELLMRFFARMRLATVGRPLIDAVIDAQDGAAIKLLECLYTHFTGREVEELPEPEEPELLSGDPSDPLLGGKPIPDSHPEGTQAFAKSSTAQKASEQALVPGSSPIKRQVPAHETVSFGAVKLSSLPDPLMARKRLARA